MDFLAASFENLSDEMLHTILGANVELQDQAEPYLEILLQPKQRGYRFRYSSEGNTHGGIQAEASEKGHKKFPTVQIANYSGKAAICVSLVTSDDPPRVHPHNLVGKDVKNGLLYFEDTKTNWICNFQTLGIQHVTKKDVINVLHEKLCQQYQLNLIANFKQEDVAQSFDIATLVESFGPSDGKLLDEAVANAVADEEKKRLLEEANILAKETDMSAVRLCFQAFITDERGELSKPLPPVYSHPIYDQKAAHAGQLKICRISKNSSSVNGDEEIFLLCDKVQKDDIEVRFFQKDERTDEILWEANGKFNQSDVHKQCAIVFKTPPFIDKAIQKPVQVQVQLRRGKDKECSPPIPFMYKPGEFDKYKIGEKRRKGLPDNLDQLLDNAASAKQSKWSSSASAASSSHQVLFGRGAYNLPASSSSDSAATNNTGIMFFSAENRPGPSGR